MTKARLSRNKGLPCECTNCHRHFTITAHDLEYYRLNRRKVPRTCPRCRRGRIKLSKDGHGSYQVSIREVEDETQQV